MSGNGGWGRQVAETLPRAAVWVGLFVGAGLCEPQGSASSSSLIYNTANPFAQSLFSTRAS